MYWSHWSWRTRKNITTLRWSQGDFFTAATQHLTTAVIDLEGPEKYNTFQRKPRDRGFEPHTGHDHDSSLSYDTSTGWFQEADSRGGLNKLHNQAKINKFKLKECTFFEDIT